MPGAKSLTREVIADIISAVTDDELQVLSRAVPEILARWKVDPSKRAALIGPGDQEAAARTDDEKLAMICIADIHAQLRLIFGVSDRAYTWMRAPNTALSGMSAIELVEREGVDGLVLVLGCLTKA